jgi:hypothetical protein
MKLRVGLILATMVLGGMLLSGVVLAKTCSHNCRGTGGDDYLTGSGSGNTIAGLGGDDTVKGLGGADWLFGDPGGDKLSGGPGVDHIRGGTGLDKLDGKKGNDHLKDVERAPQRSTARSKQRTVDALIGSPKNLTVDVLIGGRGNDTFRARDGKKDIIRGGPGHDTAYVDRVDKVTGVEKEVVPGGGTGGPQPKKQCADGKDNDGDGNTDLQDPGCAKATDDTEKNQPPVANKDSYSVYNDEHLTVTDSAKGVLSNDTDADNPNNTNAGLTVKDANPNTPEIDPVNGPTEGDLTLNTDGTFEYNHTGGCSPQPCIPPADSFTYKATDGAADSNVATVKITVCNINDPNNPPRCTKSPPPPPP